MINRNIYRKVVYAIVAVHSKGATYILVGSFLTRFLSLLGSIVLVIILTNYELGTVSIMENFYGYVYIFAGLGYSNALIRFILKSNRVEKKKAYFLESIKIGTLFNIALLLVGTLFFTFIPTDINSAYKYMLYIYLSALPFQFIIESCLLTFRAYLYNRAFAIFSVIYSILYVLIKVVMVLFFGVAGVSYSKIVVELLFVLLVFYSVYSLFFKNITSDSINSSEKKELLSYSAQYMLTNGLWLLFLLNDIFMISIITSNSQIVADYKVASTVPAAISIFSTSVGIFISPYFVQNELNKMWVWKNYLKVIKYLGLFLVFIIGVIFALTPMIVKILYGSKYNNVINIMRLLLISNYISAVFRYTTAHLFSSMGKVKFNLGVSIVGVVFQIVINLVLIKHYQAIGAAISSIIVYSLMGLLLFFLFRKEYYIKRY